MFCPGLYTQLFSSKAPVFHCIYTESHGECFPILPPYTSSVGVRAAMTSSVRRSEAMAFSVRYRVQTANGINCSDTPPFIWAVGSYQLRNDSPRKYDFSSA